MQKGVETITGIKPTGLRPKKNPQKAPAPWGAQDLQDLRRRTCDTFVKQVKVDLPGGEIRAKIHIPRRERAPFDRILHPPSAFRQRHPYNSNIQRPSPPPISSLRTVLHLALDAHSFAVTHHRALCFA